jgi:hypothetical protein
VSVSLWWWFFAGRKCLALFISRGLGREGGFDLAPAHAWVSLFVGEVECDSSFTAQSIVYVIAAVCSFHHSRSCLRYNNGIVDLGEVEWSVLCTAEGVV